jgi:hypothetical protein
MLVPNAVGVSETTGSYAVPNFVALMTHVWVPAFYVHDRVQCGLDWTGGVIFSVGWS